MDMIDVDDILRDMGIDSPTHQPPQASVVPVPTVEEESTPSDDDIIDDILQENGFAEGESEEEEADTEEDIDDTDSLERQSEEGNSTGAERLYAEVTEYLEEHPTPIESPIEESLVDEEPQEEDENNTLPLNSPTLLLDNATSRFSGTEWYNEIQKARIIVGGCGGIGSNLVFQLARMIPANITVYDDDMVEMANMAGQLYSTKDIGKFKVDAIAEMVANYTTMRSINAIRQKFTEITEAGDIMLCGFDSMTARRVFFHSWLSHLRGKSEEEKANCFFMDGRLSIDTLQVFCIKGNDGFNINRYQSDFLFADSEADETICSMKQTTYLACMIGSLMTNLFTNFIAGTLNPIIPYDLPFFTEYDAQNMIFKTEN